MDINKMMTNEIFTTNDKTHSLAAEVKIPNNKVKSSLK